MARLRRLESRVDTEWDKLTPSQKDAATRIIHPEAGKVMDVFNGHAVKING